MSADALAPLRQVYGVAAPAAPGAASLPGTEAEVLRQSRAALGTAPRLAPEARVVEAVLAHAAEASARTLEPLAAVRALAGSPPRPGGEPTAGAVPSVEAVILRQSADLLDAARAARRERPSDAAVAAVMARAAEATAQAAPADVRLADGTLAPLAAAYGLLTAAAADARRSPQERARSSEAVLLGQMRGLLEAAPRLSPDVGSLEAVRVAAAQPPPPARPVRAADRPARAGTPERARRRGVVWGTSALVGALALAALVWIGRPATTGAPAGPIVAMSTVPAEGVAEVRDAPADASATPDPPRGDPADARPARADLARADLAVARAPSAPPPPAATAPSPAPPRPSAPGRAAVPAPSARLALASADGSSAADASWDAPDDLRVISLRLQELRRAGESAGWNGPDEAFGAPAARTTASDPGVRAVRETVPVGRARVFAAPPND